MTRFLAPVGRYFPDLLDTPVDEASLVSAALAEIGHGAAWVKVIADFPDLAAGNDARLARWSPSRWPRAPPG
jgi:hypothetical protein